MRGGLYAPVGAAVGAALWQHGDHVPVLQPEKVLRRAELSTSRDNFCSIPLFSMVSTLVSRTSVAFRHEAW